MILKFKNLIKQYKCIPIVTNHLVFKAWWQQAGYHPCGTQLTKSGQTVVIRINNHFRAGYWSHILKGCTMGIPASFWTYSFKIALAVLALGCILEMIKVVLSYSEQDSLITSVNMTKCLWL